QETSAVAQGCDLRFRVSPAPERVSRSGTEVVEADPDIDLVQGIRELHQDHVVAHGYGDLQGTPLFSEYDGVHASGGGGQIEARLEGFVAGRADEVDLDPRHRQASGVRAVAVDALRPHA